MRHSDRLDSFLVVLVSRVNILQPVRVFEGSNRVREVDAMFAKILCGFAIIPFVLHVRISTGYR